MADIYEATITTAGVHAGHVYSDVDTSDELAAGLISAGFLVKLTPKQLKERGYTAEDAAPIAPPEDPPAAEATEEAAPKTRAR